MGERQTIRVRSHSRGMDMGTGNYTHLSVYVCMYNHLCNYMQLSPIIIGAYPLPASRGYRGDCVGAA